MYEYRARVRSTYDGDTVRLDISLGFGVWLNDQPFRLLGIDAPELGTAAGKPARDFFRILAPVGCDLFVITHRDAKEKYGRYLADLYDPTDLATSINQRMMDTGHAVPYDGGARS